MKIKGSFSSEKMLYTMPLSICIIYYCTYMFWDSKTRLFKYFVLALLIIGILFQLTRIIQTKKINKKSSLILELFIFLEGIFLIYAIAADNFLQRRTALYQYNFYLLLLLTALYYVNVRTFHNIINVLRYLGCLLSALSVYEFITRTYIIPVSNEWYGKISFGGTWLIRTRVFSDSPMVFGLTMAILSIIAFDYYYRDKTMINLIILVVNIIGVIMSASRGPYVSLIIGIFFYFLFDEKKNKKKLIKLFFEIILLVFALFILVNVFAESNSTIAYVQARIRSIFQWSGNTYGWTSNTTRMGLWKNALQVMFTGTNWLHGIGAAATGARSIEMGGFVTESGVLRRFVEFGLIIGSLYYIFLFTLIRYGYRKAKRYESKYIALSIALISCILIEDTILQITEEISISFFLWLFIALLINSDKGYY